MISELHETLVDEIRFSFGRFMQQHGYELRHNVAFVAEAIVANFLTGLVGIGLIADGYIFPNDGFGVIPVEVGSMRAGSGQASQPPMRNPLESSESTLIELSGYLTHATQSLKGN